MRALPGAEFLLASVTLRIGDARDPVEPRFISARFDRSNDGQDHAFLPYAASPCSAQRASRGRWRRPSARSRTSRGSSRPGLAFACPTQPRPPHPDPRSLRRTIAPLRGPGWRDNAAIPNFGKVEYFCKGGLTDFCGRRVFCPTGKLASTETQARRHSADLMPRFLPVGPRQ